MLKHYYSLSFALLFSALFIIGAAVIPLHAATPVDINSATQKELEAIKGISPATAKKIIAKRPYKSVSELSRAGLTAKTITAIKPFVKVSKGNAAGLAATATKTTTDFTKATGDLTTAAKSASSAAAKLAPGTKVNINTADQSLLEKLPEIGPVAAKAIIEGRPYNKIEDVMKIKGIKEMTFNAIKDYITVK